MKSIGKFIRVAVVAGFLVAVNLLLAPRLQAQAEPQDSIVQLTAEAQGLQLLSPDQIPIFGTFWTIMPGAGPALPSPCPFAGPDLPTYVIADGAYLVDDSATTNTVTESDLEAQATTVVNLIAWVQSLSSAPQLPGRAHPMDGGLIPPTFGGGDTNSYDDDLGTNYPPVDYGTNLWLEITNISGATVNLLVSNTVSDIQYELDGTTNLAQSGWFFEEFFYGSELTNWTPTSIQAFNHTNNLFLRVKSWADDGSGLPIWWQLEYFGYVGVDPYGDPEGDGWSNLQKFQNGMNPGSFYTPPAPQGMTITYNTNHIATVSWLPSPGTVTNYTVTIYDPQTGETTTLTTSSTSFTENLSADNTNAIAGGSPQLGLSYSLAANYGTHGSSAIGSADFTSIATPDPTIFNGPQGNISMALSDLPADLTSVNVFRQSELGLVGDLPDLNDGVFSIPAASITNGILQIPDAQVLPSGAYKFAVQTVCSNGLISDWSDISDGYVYAPFMDQRSQLKDNLRLILRAASSVGPFRFNYYPGGDWIYSSPTNYVYSDSYSDIFSDTAYGASFDVLFPVENNYVLANFVFASTNFDLGVNSFLDTGVFYGVSIDSANNSDLYLSLSPLYGYDQDNYVEATNTLAPPSLLATNQAQWILPLVNDPYIAAGEVNFYGLPYLYAGLADTGFDPVEVDAVSPGATNAVADFVDCAQPILEPNGYYFANFGVDPMPEQAGFSPTNREPVMCVAVGSVINVAGYAKFTVSNSSTGVPAYLGQYFDKAYAVDTNGDITSIATGLLSPYGNFFATQPGPVALVTMPDIDTGERGTTTVYAVSLQLDANHDGIMDLFFGGTDATSLAKPMQLWANNNYDRLLLDKDDNSFYDDDALNTSQAATCPYTPNTPTPDCNYLDGAGHRVIPCERDLQDFFRLWVCGIDTNLIAKLPAGSTVTLNWGDVGSPNTGNPTIDIFTAADPDGGIGYLTNSSTADSQIDSLYCPYIGRLAPGGSIQLNAATFANHWAGSHFIMCGVSNGTGGLNLTIADASGNVLAQSTTYLQIMDIKQMYERWTIGDQPSRAPLTNAVPATEDLPAGASAFQYTQPQDTNTSYILYVHGWNMSRYDKDRFAEAAFKRLYWQGYHGRFGSFRWPTDYDFNATLMDALFQPHNYDGSEYTAWQSAVGLLNKLNDLSAEYPGHVYVLSHSMGNVVTGEALRQAAQQGLGQIVNTYVASQAAIPAHVYDATVTSPYLIDYTYFAHGYPAPGHPLTPNIYGNRLTNNIAAVGHRISFYNVNDYALAADAWCWDQEHKPDTFLLIGNYHYAGSTNDPAPWNNFEFIPITGDPLTLDIVNNLNDRYEALAYAANPYSTALGATPVATLNQSIDMTDPNNHVWPATDPLNNNYKSHFWHSAQFRGDAWLEWNYWNTLLRSGTLGFNIQY